MKPKGEDPVSKQIGIPAIAFLPAVKRNVSRLR